MPDAAFDAVTRDGEIVALDLDRALPGVPAGAGRYRFPLPDAVQRVRVMAAPDGRGTLVVAGGMRQPLSYHLLAGGTRQLSVRFESGRLTAASADPILDDRGGVLACLFESGGRVELRILDTTGARFAVILARTLEQASSVFELRAAAGDAWTGVYLGNARVCLPGQSGDFVAVSDPAAGFLHPAAAVPRTSTTRLDFGALLGGGRGTRSFTLENPGPLPVRLLLRATDLGVWRARVQPEALTLAAGRSAECVVTVAGETDAPLLSGRLEVVAGAGTGEPLTELALRATAGRVADERAPELDVGLVEHQLLPGRRARLRGRAGAVRDANPPCRVGDPSGVIAGVAGDGSFQIEVPLPLDRRLRLWTEDAIGNRSRPAWVLGDVFDRKPPVVDAARLRLDLPEHGWTRVSGAAGAVLDDTTPVQVEVLVDGRVQEGPTAVAPDGSFSTRVRAEPGASLAIVALDGAAPLNRSESRLLGRVLPYVDRVGDDLVLFGPPGAAFDLVPSLPAAEGAPATMLRRLQGRLDGRGQARLPPDKIAGAALLRFDIERPDGAGRLVSSYAVVD